LYSLALPPTVPLWIAAVGVVVGILFGKEVFGGFGRNFANPAIVGRAFVYICFPVPLTAQFVPVFKGFPGGFTHWSFETLRELPGYLSHTGKTVTDAVSQGSPMWINKELGAKVAEQGTNLWELFTGSIGGTFQADGQVRILSAGSIGEGCALLIILCAVYLLVTKTANWRLMLSCVLGLGFATLLLRHLLGFDGSDPATLSRYIVPTLPFTLFAGTTLYVTVFMVTDPVSAPKRRPAQYAYGFLVGFLIVFLRWRGIFVAAASFAVLGGNMIAPLLDMAAKGYADRKKRIAAAAEGRPGS
jgi:Na+-transporting NADH:ubiquinone oxidoreductase subunit B